MHYDISYNGLEGQEKINKALQDIKDWWGDAKFDEIVTIGKKDPYTRAQFRMALSFGGVQGYPVDAMFIHIYGQEAYDAEYIKEVAELKQEAGLTDTTDPTMPMGPNGNERVD